MLKLKKRGTNNFWRLAHELLEDKASWFMIEVEPAATPPGKA
jgi:hypothetical protein